MIPDAELRVLEEKWEARVRFAKLRLDLCRLYTKHMQTLATDTPPPDGGFAYRKALRSERAALAQYSHTLRIYSDLVVYEIIPREDSKSHR